jgi:hypothetical protein
MAVYVADVFGHNKPRVQKIQGISQAPFQYQDQPQRKKTGDYTGERICVSKV